MYHSVILCHVFWGRFHETPHNLQIIAGEIVHRPCCEFRRIMRRKSSCDASQCFVKLIDRWSVKLHCEYNTGICLGNTKSFPDFLGQIMKETETERSYTGLSLVRIIGNTYFLGQQTNSNFGGSGIYQRTL